MPDPETAGQEPAARLPALQAAQCAGETVAEATPGHQLQVDVKFIEPLGQKRLRRKMYYQFTAIDDCTRLRVLRAYPSCDPRPRSFVDDVMAKLPFQVERLQIDNGSEFGTSFHLHVLDLGVDHVRIKPRRPRLNGKMDGSHQIDSEEFYRLLEGQVIDALQGPTHNERLRQKPPDPLS